MDEQTYKNLIGKLNKLLNETSSSAIPFRIEPGMSFDSFSKSELLLAHVLLHKFYAMRSKHMTQAEIKKLHAEIAKRIKHERFDELDDD